MRFTEQMRYGCSPRMRLPPTPLRASRLGPDQFVQPIRQLDTRHLRRLMASATGVCNRRSAQHRQSLYGRRAAPCLLGLGNRTARCLRCRDRGGDGPFGHVSVDRPDCTETRLTNASRGRGSGWPASVFSHHELERFTLRRPIPPPIKLVTTTRCRNGYASSCMPLA